MSSGPGATPSPVAPEVRPLSQREFDQFQRFIHREAGIHLSQAKKALLVRRLGRRVRELGLRSFSAYYRHLEAVGEAERTRVLDAICTNETRFFREPRHFEFLAQRLVPHWLAEAEAGRRPRELHAWSAACSTGEEPFSMAMVLLRHLQASAGWRLNVLASDLSTRVCEAARGATWPVEQAAEIPEQLKKEFMLRGVGSQQGRMRADDRLRSVVRFQRVNLNDAAYPVSGPFDVIFCRNVMIYFDAPTKQRVVSQLLRHLAPGGLLFVGLAESLRYLELGLRCLEPGVYAKASARAVPGEHQ